MDGPDSVSAYSTGAARRSSIANQQPGGATTSPTRDQAPAAQRRNRAFQAYLAANTARHLLPANENVGALTPDLKREES